MTNLEEYVLNEQLRKISDRVDFGVMSMLLVDSCGWTSVELNKVTFVLDAIQIVNWTNKICGKRKFMHYGEKFVFADAEDALMFELKWS